MGPVSVIYGNKISIFHSGIRSFVTRVIDDISEYVATSGRVSLLLMLSTRTRPRGCSRAVNKMHRECIVKKTTGDWSVLVNFPPQGADSNQ